MKVITNKKFSKVLQREITEVFVEVNGKKEEVGTGKDPVETMQLIASAREYVRKQTPQQNPSLLKDAVKLNDKYKAVMLELDDTKNDDQRIVDEVKFQLQSLKYDYLIDEDLESQGYGEGQIKRMKNTAIKHMESFLAKYDN